MDVIEALTTRRSVRGFKEDPVSRETVLNILRAAIRTPSGLNTQPWQFVVASGPELDKIRAECTRLFMEDAAPTSAMFRQPLQGIYRKRQVDLAIEIFKIIGIEREDKKARKEWMQRGYRFFDAPCEILVCLDKNMSEPIDFLAIGAVCVSICLAAWEYGLGTCWADQGIFYDRVWHEYAGITQSKRIVAGIALGYPDPDFPLNKMVTPREPVDNIVTWLGY